MDTFQAIVLGIVQGLTEFLPISSSGHLRIVPAFAGWEDPGAAFTAVIQLGTMAAVLLYFRHDLINIARGWFAGLRDPAKRGTLDSRMGWYLIIGTIPIVIFGLVFSDPIEDEARNLTLIGTTLIVLGLVLLLAERCRASATREVEDVTSRDAVIIGFAQAAALVPGVSRSGATITAGPVPRLRPRGRRALLVPAVGAGRRAVGLYQMRDIGGEGAVGFVPTALATIFAFISGYVSIAFLLKFLVNHTTTVFVVYRVVLGASSCSPLRARM